MGSRTPGNFRKFSGDSRVTAGRVRNVQAAMRQKRAATVVVQTAVDVMAVTHPAIGTLVATYKVSKVAYQVVKTANEEYQRTGSADKAASAAAKEVVRTAVGETRDQAIETIVDVGWTGIKKAAGIHTNEMTDRVLTSAVKNTLHEEMPK